MEIAVLLVQSAMVAALGVWMAVAVADNWIHPALNHDSVAMVMRYELMEKEYPEHYRHVAHRRVENPTLIRLAFNLIRLAETVAAFALLASAVCLAMAAVGGIATETAQVAAIASAALFTLIWAGFIIGGNYFSYWYCHQWGQMNHFSLLFWGFFVLLILLVG